MRRLAPATIALTIAAYASGENWLQFKFDSRQSGNVPDRTVQTPLGLIGAVPLSDSIFTAPVVADGKVYVLDGAGVAWCIDAVTLQVLWKFTTAGGNANCNNTSSPALANGHLHFGTMAGRYYVLDAATGQLRKEIFCGDPILAPPVVTQDRVYFATLGARVYALTATGEICWIWDFVKEVLRFSGDRWSAADWLAHKKGGRVNWQDQFSASTGLAALGKQIVLPAGGRVAWLHDDGPKASLVAIGEIPAHSGREYPALFGLSLGEDGAAYLQWHRRDNAGRVEIMRLHDGKVQCDFVAGTQTAINLPSLMSFCSVSLRGHEVYRCRPEHGFGLCRHSPKLPEPEVLAEHPSIAPPILLRNLAVVGGLDGALSLVPLDNRGKPWSFKTAFGQAITAPPAVCDGRIYFGCEDGYLYVLGPHGKAPLPNKDLALHKIRSPLTSKLADARYDWFTNYGDLSNSNANDQGFRPPLKMKWVRRYEGTFKHLPVFGGGRMYTHTAEGQIFAVEQETGRLLWRRYWPDVHLSFTSPIYWEGRLLVPQAGLKRSMLRCLDAATGNLIWEAPFSGSPSWTRQGPPVIHKHLAIYAFGTGRYAPQGSAKAFVFRGDPVPSPNGAEIMSFIYSHDNPYYPRDNHPIIRAYDLDTGKVVWEKNFVQYGTGGNNCGLCLMNDTLYYSTFFGYLAPRKGLTAALDPLTGNVRWWTTNYYVTSGCTISAQDGRLYLGGYNRPHERTDHRYIFCLNASDGSLVWQSEPIRGSANVVSVGRRFLFSNTSNGDGHLFDRDSGKIISRFNFKYACTRFTLSEPYLLGANMDIIDLANGNRLVSTGPALESRECVGAVVSNGRLFYTAQANGLQMSQVGADEAEHWTPPWQHR
ncbi:MAG: PQQ-binding-like beta-propeller repeat protein [Verrucomicrobiae bacterium]|nr:PQQ-binding-like beta-propeller repeat protein [Verrucomicrobiae bacterium]